VSEKFLGITVLGDFILCEGADAVLENVLRAGATAVACNPTVTSEADENTGSFQPPIDGGSSPRLFDRPLYGKQSLWVRSGVSYRPNADFYQNSPYSPRQPNDLTDAHGAVIGEFIDKSIASGLKVYFQIGAAQPSGLRDEDRPLLPNGDIPPNRMADTGSLASAAIRAYNLAYIKDLLATYPNITGFRPDWPENPCYTLGEVFQDFSPHVRDWAEDNGFDFDRIQSEVGLLYDYLHGNLTTDNLFDLASPNRGKTTIVSMLVRYPGIADWLRLKAALSNDTLREWRDAITDAGGAAKELSANAFMVPYSNATGLDFQGAAEYCDSISPKLYTMHWSLMVKFWGDELLKHNADLDEETLVAALVNLMDLADGDEAGTRIADYGYPNPDEPHPIPDNPQLRKIKQVTTTVAGRAAVYPLVHGYGPLDDFARRLNLVADSGGAGLWINRYGYLSDAKLDVVTKVWN